MAKKAKASADIVGLPSEDKLMVQKSLPLFSLWRSGLTLPEFKILDVYLARIDSHHPEKRVVVFEKGELEHILGVQTLRREDLSVRLDHLMGHVVTLSDVSRKGFRKVTLFEEAVAEQDPHTSQWTVRMECTQKAMKYFFNIEQLGYLRYKLRSITSITSRYSYILFTYIEHNRYRKEWTVSVDELRQMMGCTEDTYAKYKYFNDKILKRAQAELHAKTDCHFTYEPIKTGRSVTAIRFSVESLKGVEGVDQLTPIEEILQAQESREEERDLWYEVIEEMQLSDAQYDELKAALSCVPRDRMPSMGAGIEVDRFHYIEQIYLDLKARDEEKPIKNQFRYILKIVKNDGKEG